jgi:hypothetical protein
MKRLATGVLAAVFLSSVPSAAQDVSVSLSAGLFLPRQELYKDIYGTGIPVSLDLCVGLTDYLGASAGVVFLKQDGLALPLAGEGEEYPLEFRRVTVPVSLYLRFGRDNPTFRVGAGAAYHSFREKWTTVDAEHKGTKWSLLLQACCEVRLVPRLSLVGSLRTTSVSVEDGSPFGRAVNLGGLTALAGLSFRIR